MSAETTEPKRKTQGVPPSTVADPPPVPLIDHDRERQVLGVLMLFPERFADVRAALCSDDFDHAAHVAIYSTMCALVDRGEAIEIGAVVADLRSRERLNAVGGPQYLGELTDTAVTSAYVEKHAAGLARLAEARRLLRTAHEITGHADQVALAPHEFATKVRASLAKLEALRPKPTAAPALTPQSTAELILSLGDRGDPIPCGIGALDRSIEGGGFLRGDVIAMAAPPGGCKTMLSVQFAATFATGLATSGCVVVIYAGDERAEGLACRLAQRLNYSRRDLRGRSDASRAMRDEAAARVAEEWSHIHWAAARRGYTVDSAIALLRRLMDETGRPGVLVIDSINVARSDTSDTAENPRARIEAIARTIHAASDEGMLVIFTSQVTQTMLRDRKATPDTDPLGAMKETSDLAHLVDVLLVLRRAKGEPGCFDVEIPKLRDRAESGAVDAFRLRLDARTATLSEVPMPSDDQSEAATEREGLAKLAKVRESVLAVVAKHADLRSANQVCALLRGDKTLKLDAIRSLTEEGRIGRVAGVFRVLAESSDDDAERGSE